MSGAPPTQGPTLAERLGFDRDARLLIVNCDDLGSSASANAAIAETLGAGTATSATLMVPCPWALDGVAKGAAGGVGVHLTLTAEYPGYRWRSLTGGHSLHDGEGCLPRTAAEVWANADLAEVRAECIAQIEQAMAWGVEITHLDTHMGAMQLDARFHGIFVELARAYRLPVRMLNRAVEAQYSVPSRTQADAAGVLYPDHLINVWGRPPKATFLEQLRRLRPGVTEAFFHPVIDGPELRSYDLTEADIRVNDRACLLDQDVADAIVEAGAKLISFAPLRDLQRR